MKAGDFGPLMAALVEQLEQARETERLTTTRELAESTGHPLRNVRRAVERLRLRKTQIADLADRVKDGRATNGTFKRHKRPRVEPMSIVEAAIRSRSLLERAWRSSGMGELA